MTSHSRLTPVRKSTSFMWPSKKFSLLNSKKVCKAAIIRAKKKRCGNTVCHVVKLFFSSPRCCASFWCSRRYVLRRFSNVRPTDAFGFEKIGPGHRLGRRKKLTFIREFPTSMVLSFEDRRFFFLFWMKRYGTKLKEARCQVGGESKICFPCISMVGSRNFFVGQWEISRVGHKRRLARYSERRNT